MVLKHGLWAGRPNVRAMTARQSAAVVIVLNTAVNVAFGITASVDRQVRGMISASSFGQFWDAITNRNGVYSWWPLLTLAIAFWIFLLGNLAVATVLTTVDGHLSTAGWVLLYFSGIAVTCAVCVSWLHLPEVLTSMSGDVRAAAEVVTVLTPIIASARWAWVWLGKDGRSPS
jgi:hypothetical protein